MTIPADAQLRGTPYLVAAEEPSRLRFSRLQERSLQIREQAVRVNAGIAERAAGLLAPFETAIRTELVAESNQMEGYDWSSTAVRNLVQTHRELLSAPLHNFLNVLRNDTRVFEALGLYRAHLLADEWGMAGQRPREFEIRALHALLAAGETYAGAYKDTSNSIGGSTHRTTEPWDVARAMQELAAWWRASQNDPILDATVVHAWLTHIHPFIDGNGRMARLLANLTLVQSQYPPLILRSGSDQGQYYDALAQSDAGDILPLYDLFTQVTRRTVRIMSRPDYVREVVEDRLLTSTEDARALWQRIAEMFAEKVGRELSARGWGVEVMGYRDRTAFGLLLDRDAEGNGWFLRVRDAENRPVWLLWFGYISDELLADLPGMVVCYPSVFFSVRDRDASALHPYRWVLRHDELPNEMLFRPLTARPVLIRYGQRVVELSVDAAAEAVARALVEMAALHEKGA